MYNSVYQHISIIIQSFHIVGLFRFITDKSLTLAGLRNFDSSSFCFANALEKLQLRYYTETRKNTSLNIPTFKKPKIANQKQEHAMGWTYRKRVKLMPGVHLNISQKGVNTTIGKQGASVNFSSRGTRINNPWVSLFKKLF